MTPLILAVAPNGARRGKADHPRLPITIEETAREAARCREAGACMLHLHVRDSEGRHSLDADLYRNGIAVARREAGADLLVQITTESVGLYAPALQRSVVDAVAPEAVSLALRELAPDEDSLGETARFLARHAARGAFIQYILYDIADVARFDDLLERGVVPAAGASRLFVLGRYAAGQTSEPRDLLPFLASAAALPWMMCAFGAREAASALLASALDGHARVGFENNLSLPDGSRAADNPALVEITARAAVATGRPLATPDDARRIFSGG